jgi:hypothetical protein
VSDYRFRVLKSSDEPGEDGAREVGASSDWQQAKGQADRLAQQAKEDDDEVSVFVASDSHRQYRQYRGKA